MRIGKSIKGYATEPSCVIRIMVITTVETRITYLVAPDLSILRRPTTILGIIATTMHITKVIVNIKISNPKGTIPGKLNEEKTTKENPVLIVNAYLIYNPDTKESMIKYIDV